MLKVFLVEDERVIREGLRDNIPWEQYGYRFIGEASDGEMALPMIRKLKPDVLITDIKMPFMDGLSLSEIVKEEFPKTKIIIISGYDDFEYARGAILVGAEQYLLKPIYQGGHAEGAGGAEDKDRNGAGTENLSGKISERGQGVRAVFADGLFCQGVRGAYAGARYL